MSCRRWLVLVSGSIAGGVGFGSWVVVGDKPRREDTRRAKPSLRGNERCLGGRGIRMDGDVT